MDVKLSVFCFILQQEKGGVYGFLYSAIIVE